MAKIKSQSGWRRTPLSCKMGSLDLAEVAKTYRKWLCQHHGWYTDRATCKKCSGSGRGFPQRTVTEATWKKHRRAAGRPYYWTDADAIDCPNCDGLGTVQLNEPILDLKRAESHVHKQQEILDGLAAAAITKVQAKLRERGLRPVIYQLGSPVPQTLAEYDDLEAEYNLLKVEHNEAEDAAVAYRDKADADYEAMDEAQKLEYLNNYEDTKQRQTLRELEQKAGDLSRQLWNIRSYQNYWYRPGSPETMWVDTQRRRNHRGAPDATAEIVIRPGSSPGDGEIELIVDQALAELFPTELQVAA